MEAIAATPMEQLKILEHRVYLWSSEKYPKDILDVCAKGTKFVDKLICDGLPLTREIVQLSFSQPTELPIVYSSGSRIL